VLELPWSNEMSLRAAATAIAILTAFVTAAPAPANAQQTLGPHGEVEATLACVDCHTTDGWQPTRDPLDFDHTAQTAFPLAGRHGELSCTTCHLERRFDQPRVAASGCTACHVDVHQGNLSPDCTSCHGFTTFRDVPGISVHMRTSFPLTGSHLQVTCASCHVDDVGGAYTTLDPDCYSCHSEDYETAGTLDHVALGFPTTCDQCHNTLAFGGGVAFDHVAASGGFPLLGAHDRIRCESCHILPGLEPIYPATSVDDCIACHSDDYNQEHGGSNFPTTCLDCHSVETWDGADFDHNAFGAFALRGAHTTLGCTSCHLQPGNQLLFPIPQSEDDCVACHRSDYDTEHSGSGFPETCLTCHAETTWGGATFEDHDAQYFPINSGKHQGEWASCQTCHTVPANYVAFTCFDCHEHDRTSMDDKHKDMPGYSYDSQVCLSCHPDGRKP